MGVPMVGCRCPVCRSDDPKNTRTRAGVLVSGPDGSFVIDTPPELRVQLLREDVDVVHAALFTHAHADHIMGLDDLRICGLRLKRPIPVWCESLVEDHLRKAFFYAFEPPNPAAHAGSVPQFDVRPIKEPLAPFETCGLTVTPLRLFHGKMPILGFRVGNIAYCTDVSRIPDETWPRLEGLDVLVIDALRFEEHPTHFNVDQAVAVIERVKPKQAYLTHISHQLDHATMNRQLADGINLAYDGLRLPINAAALID